MSEPTKKEPLLIPGIPIVGAMDDAPEGISYLATHMAIKNAVLAASVPIEKGQKDAAVEITWLAAPIHPATIERMVGFFRAIYDKHGTEAGLLGEYHPVNKTWRLRCPKQTATQAHVDMDLGSLEPEAPWLRALTAHSHGSMGAFHSGTDTSDEAEFDGLHITVGRLDKLEPEFDVELVVRGYRKQIKLATVLGTFGAYDAPQSWIDQVEVRTYRGGWEGYPAYPGGEIGFGGHRPPAMPRTTEGVPAGKRARRRFFRRRLLRQQGKNGVERIDGQMGLAGNRALEKDAAQALLAYEQTKAGFKKCAIIGCDKDAVRYIVDDRQWVCIECADWLDDMNRDLILEAAAAKDRD